MPDARRARPGAAMLAVLIALAWPVCGRAQAPPAAQVDPYLWLERSNSDSTNAWVDRHNARTHRAIGGTDEYSRLYADARDVLMADDRIVYPSIEPGWVSSYRREGEHSRGTWRHASWASYVSGKPEWQPLLSIDSLSQAESIAWSWRGATCAPGGRRCLVRLAAGGAQSVELREFDVDARAFVEGGFHVPLAPTTAVWIDDETLLVATGHGPADLTASGQPRRMRVWSRGTSLDAAPTIFEAAPGDVGVWPWLLWDGGHPVPLVVHRSTGAQAYFHAVRGTSVTPLGIPTDANPLIVGGQLVLRLRSDWRVGERVFPSGAVVSTDLRRFLDGARAVELVARPPDGGAIQEATVTREALYLTHVDGSRSELRRYARSDGGWRSDVVPLPDHGSLSIVSADESSDRVIYEYESFLRPPALYLVDGAGPPRVVDAMPARLDTAGMTVSRLQTTSADGIPIPYWVVGDTTAGPAPTQVYAYGGFGRLLVPSFDAIVGRLWLERGGIYIVANVRGGGEFGPAWHRAAMRDGRQRSFDDLIAVAEDAIARGITTPSRLAIHGSSNGGLLVSAVMVQRPELFAAVVARIPVTDMRRFHELLGGASWIEEYGNPDDPDDWAFLSLYSPYHNVRPGHYPSALVTTASDDDVAHPAHARKMVARLEEYGHEAYYFELTGGGHDAGDMVADRARSWALVYAFLWSTLSPG